MSAIWAKFRPHLLSWHMVPCLAMLAAAIAVAIATGQPGRVLGAVGCMAMMIVVMAAMGGHDHTGHDHESRGSHNGRPGDRPAAEVSRRRSSGVSIPGPE